MKPRAAQEVLRPGGVISLLAVLLFILAPHVTRLPLWVSAAVMVLLLWRGWRALRPGALLSKWALVALTIIGTSGVVVTYGPRLGRDASVALLAIMLALKIQELRAMRDAVVVICLGFFLVITNFLYSQTMTTATYMAFATIWLTGTLVAFQDRNRTLQPLAALRAAGMLALQGAPLMIVLFLLFPRVQGPLFGFPQATTAGVTGLSDTMSPGSLSNLSLSDEVAFRVQFRSRTPKFETLYWRGPVLWVFDGRTWTVGDVSTTATGGARYEDLGTPIEYTVTLEPHYQRWLFAIDLPGMVPSDAAITSDYQMLARRPIRNRVRYDMRSSSSYRYGTDESREIREYALRLPRGYNPRSVQLAREIRGRSANDREVVRNVLNMFNTELFFYTLVPPELGRNSVDEFLFGTRRGFCEHYASAFVFLMRAAGMPARVVTGYQGGVMNPLGDYLIVRQSEAHAWAEVWLQDAGWVRVDPTAAVSPARIQVGIAAAVPAGDPLPIAVRGDFELLRSLRFTWDAVANSWNQWVLGYSPERQLQLLRNLGFESATWQTIAVLMMAMAALVLGALSLGVLSKLRPKKSDPAARAWMAFQRKLAKRGVAPRPGEGPQTFAERASSAYPALAQHIAAIASLYVRIRYAKTGTKADLRELARRVRALKVA